MGVIFEIQIMIIFEFRFTEFDGMRMMRVKNLQETP